MGILAKIWAFLVDSVQTLLLAAAVFLVIYIFLFRPFQVNGHSMDPNYQDGEYILTNLVVLHFKMPQLGDVVVFTAPKEPDKDFIKRVIGMAGDQIMLKSGSVYRNGTLLNENKYLDPNVKTYGGSFLAEGAQVTVPEDSYFVLGDNRPNSSDSREWGFVKKDLLIGESFFVYWPPNKMELIRNPY
ncbi:MAG TPA: signal peptidase I [Candidatus Saccharimonadales bacterium]|nr:signal peptidase I [Candidatus Saccharimonadales bacterium]